MTLTQQLIAQFDDETPRTRRVLQAIPADRDDWKPHPKSMTFGRLAGLLASMPAWINLVIDKDELDVTPKPGGSGFPLPSTKELVQAHDATAVKARDALSKVDDTFLLTTNWRLKAGGKIVSEQPRLVVIRDNMTHMAHHRGQLTVYLRLNDLKVPSVFGPSADDQEFR
jgi:uncharacterized damage-inducible protein DinB